MPYQISRNGQTFGPYTLEDLQRYVASGNVLPTDLAKSEEMAEWVPVAQVLGASMPASPAPVIPYAGGAPAYPAAGVIYPDPPNLHWALVLLIGICTCGLFSLVWMIVQAAWMRKVNPNSKALTYYIAAIVLDIVSTVAQVGTAMAGKNGTSGGGLAVVYLVCGLACCVLFLVAIFTMRSDIEAHFNGPEPIGLSLSGVMTFFFSVLYFQYHFSRINELKHQARYRGAAV